jgi:GvpH.
MTDTTDRDDAENRDTSGSIPLGSVFQTLSELLDQLEEMDTDAGERRSGSVQRGEATFDYEVDIRSLDSARRGRLEETDGWEIRGQSETHEYRVRVDDEAGELVVVADLPTVSADDIEVGTTDEGLDILVDGELLESVPLDWDGAAVTDVTFTNQVLEVRVEPPDGTETGRDRGDHS